MVGLLDNPQQQPQQPQAGFSGGTGIPMLQWLNNVSGGQVQFPATPGAGPAPLTPFQQAQLGTPMPQGFNPANLIGGMGGMPVPQGYAGPSPTMGMGGMPAVAQPSMGGLNQAGLNAANAGLHVMQNSQPQPAQMQAPSMLGGGAVPQARMGPGGAAAPTGGMGGGMLNPQLLKMLMGAGTGTA